MSNESFEEGGEDSEDTPTIVSVESEGQPHLALARLSPVMNADGQQSGLALHRARHGDFYLNPAAFGRFNDEWGRIDHDAMHLWMAEESPEAPESSSTEPDIQGWTYIADYTLHALTPNHNGPYQYFIHARIRHDNCLEFGVFPSIVQESRGTYRTALAMLDQASSSAAPMAQQIHHGDILPPLRIASKEEAEAMLLKGGRLIMAACPRAVGVLMNTGQAKIRRVYSGASSYRLLPYYGHIWTYWAAIIDNVLYMVGIPLYTGNDNGTYAYSIGDSAGRVSVPLPPTLHDVRSEFVGNTNAAPSEGFLRAVDMLWGVDPISGFASTVYNVTAFLEAYGDYSSSVVLCRRALARIDQEPGGGYTVEQVRHGDISAALTLLGPNGGVYVSGDGALTIAEGEQVENAYVERSGPHSWGGESGASGFIPTTTRCTVEGRVRYSAQAFYVASNGPCYIIRATSPFHPYGYTPEEDDPGYKLLPHYDASVTVPRKPDEDPEDDAPPDDDGGWGGGGGGGGGGDDDDDGNGAEDIGDCGIWLEESEGVRVHRAKVNVVGDIRYLYTIKVTSSVTVTETLLCILTAKFSVNDGNSYSVGGGQTVTMWYYLQGIGASILVRNLTSYSSSGGSWVPNTHPSSVTDFEQVAQVASSAKGKFPNTKLSSRASVAACNQSNIVQLVPTGGIRKFNASMPYIGADGRKHIKRVKGTQTRYKLVLQKANIKTILKNTIRQQATNMNCRVTPSSITGTAGGTAGAPTVTSDGATLAPTQAQIQGESAVKGTFEMEVSGKIGAVNATYNLTHSFTGWYEETPSNRYSANISGTFTVTSEAISF